MPKKPKNNLTPDKFSFHPAVRPDDLRLDSRVNTGEQLPKRKKGDPGLPGAGRPSRETAVQALLEKLEEKIESDFERRKKRDGTEAKKRVTLKEEINNVIVNGALGKIHLTPSQIAAIKEIYDRDEGKAKQKVEVDSDQPLIIFDLDLGS